MKTAVEYLYTQLQMNNEILEKGTRVHQEIEEKIFEQAKEMEKQQIMDAYQTSHISMMTAEQYYNEKFKQQQDGSNTDE